MQITCALVVPERQHKNAARFFGQFLLRGKPVNVREYIYELQSEYIFAQQIKHCSAISFSPRTLMSGAPMPTETMEIKLRKNAKITISIKSYTRAILLHFRSDRKQLIPRAHCDNYAAAHFHTECRSLIALLVCYSCHCRIYGKILTP